MKIERVHNKITINGNIKSLQHYKEFEKLVDNDDRVHIILYDSISIVSSFVLLIKKYTLRVSCSNKELSKLLLSLDIKNSIITKNKS